MANVGRETVLKRNGNVIAGVRVLGLEWKSETVDISQGESDGYRLACEIDGLSTIDIQVEGISKDHEFQEIALSRSGSRLLENVVIELANPNGIGTTLILTDFFITNFSLGAEFSDAIVFSCSLVGSAKIIDGEITNVDRDPQTGQITGTPGIVYYNSGG